MIMSKNQSKYEPLALNLNKPFMNLTGKEAKDYFKWFIENIDNRSEYLKEKIANDLNISVIQLDYSFLSLKIVWKWFLKVYEISNYEFNVFTEYVLRDIGMYVSKVFILNFPDLEWVVRNSPKTYVHVNKPLIIGFIDSDPEYPKPFYPELEPVDLVRTPAMLIFENKQKEEDLYDECLKWVNLIPIHSSDKLVA